MKLQNPERVNDQLLAMIYVANLVLLMTGIWVFIVGALALHAGGMIGGFWLALNGSFGAWVFSDFRWRWKHD